MAALTQDRPTPEREGRLVSDPLAANAVVFAGALYVLDAAGNATPATAAAANRRKFRTCRSPLLPIMPAIR